MQVYKPLGCKCRTRSLGVLWSTCEGAIPALGLAMHAQGCPPEGTPRHGHISSGGGGLAALLASGEFAVNSYDNSLLPEG